MAGTEPPPKMLPPQPFHLMAKPIGAICNLGCEYCFYLEKEELYRGECARHRLIHSPHGEPGLNYLCAAYKRFFHYAAPHGNTMGKLLRRRLPPVGIMDILQSATI